MEQRMNNFMFHNPTKIIFGRNTISELQHEISKDRKILLLYGGGSIKNNGVYDQVKEALAGYDMTEFNGIEANPQYSTCMKAVQVVKENDIDFLLSVGGGSVLDATKFIAAASCYDGADAWSLMSNWDQVTAAIPLGCVLTLPATGSESNPNTVISRKETGEKLALINTQLFPQFSILDPKTTLTLPVRQIANGVVDAFVHTIEQYMTYPVNAPLQDRYSESILLTLIEAGPKALENPQDYDTRATIMWAATLALNLLNGSGVPQDWQTHSIGHELTALHGIDHARTLSIVLPAVLKHQRDAKSGKLIQYGKRVWGIRENDKNKAADLAIKMTVTFFKQMGVPTCLSDVHLTPGDVSKTVDALAARGMQLGEHGNVGPKEIAEILQLAA
jgi:NADP-dependent alcohol dehydrogenase